MLLEPTGRNTAPAMTLAALQALEGGADPVLVVTPADQTVTDGAGFPATAVAAASHPRSRPPARSPSSASRPTGPETGFGYIRCVAGSDAGALAASPQFVEKPDLATAESYVARRRLRFWNSGMFVMRASVSVLAAAHWETLSPRHRRRDAAPRGHRRRSVDRQLRSP